MRRTVAAVLLIAAAGVAAVIWFAAGDRSTRTADSRGNVRPAEPREFVAPERGDSATGPSQQLASVSGIVTWRGSPADAAVELFRVRDAVPGVDLLRDVEHRCEPVGTGRTDAEGHFRVAVRESGRHVVVARDAGGRTASESLLVARTGASEVVLALPDGPWSLRGVVRNADGTAFSGRVTLAAAGPWGVPYVLGTTAAARDGGFAFAGVAFRRVRLEAVDPGRRSETGPWIVLPHDGDVTWTLGAGVRPLRGVVVDLDSGAPIKGARLRTSGPEWARVVAADRDGRFVVDVPANVPGWITATAAGYGETDLDILPGTQEVVARLARQGRIVGVVVRRDGGGPAAGAHVFASAVEGGWTSRTTVADAHGRFTLDVPPGWAQYGVFGGGWMLGPDRLDPGLADDWAVEVASGGTAHVVLVAVPTARAEITVTGPEGRAVPGAEVSIDEVEGRTGPDGRVALEGFAREHILLMRDSSPHVGPTVQVVAAGFRRESVRLPIIAEGEAPQVAVQLERGATLEVHVRASRDDAPIAGAAVSVHWQAHAATDANGVARIEHLATGATYVCVAAAGFADWEQTIVLVATAEAEQVEVKLVRPEPVPPERVDEPGPADARETAGTIRVQVADAAGRPVPNWTCEFRQEGGEEPASSERHYSSGGSDAELKLKPGRNVRMLTIYDARDAAGRRVDAAPATFPMPSPPPDVWEVTLPRGLSIRGRVVDAEGRGVEGVHVIASQQVTPAVDDQQPTLERVGTASTDGDGAFLVPGLAPGSASLTLRTWGAHTATPPTTVPVGRDDVVFVLAAAPPVVLTVVDETGTPVCEAYVGVRPIPAEGEEVDPWNGPLAEARTDVKGVARLRDVPTGKRLILTVAPPEARTDALLSQEVHDWQRRDERIVLAMPHSVSGVVRLPDGSPASGALLSREVDGSTEDRIPVAADGTFRLKRLRAGETVRLRCNITSGYYGYGTEVEAVAGTNDVEIVVEPGAFLRVRLGGPGSDWTDADVSVRVVGRSHQMRWANAVAGESVVIGGLDPQDGYTVLVTKGSCNVLGVSESVRADGREVNVPLARGRPVSGRVVVSSGAAGDIDGSVTVGRGDVSFAQAGVHGGKFEFAGLPPGPLRLTFRGWRDGRDIVGEVDVTAGDADVVLRVAPE